jgi:hypothetical protein
MINENLGKLVQHARDKKPTNFKKVLTDEIDSRINTKVTEIKDGLAKSMFKENCEGHPDGVEHTHDDGTVHTHEGGEKPHTHEDEESIHEANPYVRKLSKPAQKVFHQVMHIINKEPSDYQSGKQSGALVDDEGNRLNPKDLAAVKMAVQNESANESIHEAKISVATDASDWKPAKEAKKFNLKASVAKGKAKPSMPGGGDPDRLDLVGDEADIVAFFKAHFGAEGNESLKDLQKEFGEEVEEGKLPPALQKAIDAKKKNNSKSDDEDKSPEDDEDKKKDENLANFGNKKKIITKDDADGTEDGNDEPDVKDDKDGDNKPDKKAKKEDIRGAAKRILRGK